MKTAKIIDPIYNKSIWLTYGTIEEVEEWYKKKDITDKSESSIYWEAFVCFIERDEGNYHIKDLHVHFSQYGFTRLVHETHHLTAMVMSDVGIPLCDETREAYAYYQDWIAGEIRDQFEKWIAQDRKRKKKNVSK